MKLKNKKFITIIRLLRPLLHFLVMLFIYRIAYILRSNTNIFWSIDIGTPWIATQELIRYAIISASIFIITGIVHKRYDLISLETGKTKTLQLFAENFNTDLVSDSEGTVRSKVRFIVDENGKRLK